MFFDLAHGYFAGGIARRLNDLGVAIPAERELHARCHALSGNLVSLLR